MLAALAFVALVTVASVAALRSIAPRLGLVDHPEGRRAHATPVPLVGGISIFIAMAIAAALFGQPPTNAPIGIEIGVTLRCSNGKIAERWATTRITRS